MLAPFKERLTLESVLDHPYFFPSSSEHDEALLFHGHFVADVNKK